jgi:hypothetical protein
VDGGWFSDPFAPNWSLEHFKDEEIVLVDEADTAEPDWEGFGGPGAMYVHHLVSRRP